MTVITTTATRAAVPGPPLTAAPAADRVVAVLFGLTVALFLLGLVLL
ncbi:hypothetical protein [Pseudonocardia hydrocarbonoxydans]|uniref:Uncharacterized protein n=1 Tax=Pseudonocardia hydrocarbonoxydans TaxID=76726 RepID=A0A4Y3WJ99_9PSEU|nr:hypothetical protein [Pseudonocardia hydrocarbonoxydans]GEC18331.1 hypothetical protein PHY01_06140 [Pseudonocardia hydrocarbonoxydans]